ncbi:MAG: hypothetical protein QM734_07050 [Cyclobacteriaceae bacterium]
MNKKDKRLKYLLFIPLIYFGYSVYTAIYPLDEFYKEDFKEVTGVDFPDQGKIIFKTASYPDIHGDYGSVSIVNVERDFYASLEKQLMIKGLQRAIEKHGSKELDEALKEIGGKSIESEFDFYNGHGVYYYVGFLSDKETLIIYKQRS